MPNFICIQETCENAQSKFHIDGFSIVSNYRNDRSGGGTCIFANNRVQFRVIPNTTTDIEYTQIEAQLSDFPQPVNIISLYLPPTFNLPNVLIIGDFNAKSPLWGAPVLDYRGKTIEKFMEDTDLICLNTGEPTRISNTGKLSHLDLSLCSANLGSIANWKVLNDNWNSDHYPTITKIEKNTLTVVPSRPVWDFKNANWDNYKGEVVTKLSSIIRPNNNVDTWDDLSSIIISSAEIAIPQRKNFSTPIRRLPYWTKMCTNAIADRLEAEKNVKKNRTFENIFAFQKMKVKVKKTLEEAKQSYWQNYVSSLTVDTTLTSVWRAVKTMSGQYSNRNFPLVQDGNGLLLETDKANYFASEFSRVSSNENLPADYRETRKCTVAKYLSDMASPADRCPDLGSDALNKNSSLIELNQAFVEFVAPSACRFFCMPDCSAAATGPGGVVTLSCLGVHSARVWSIVSSDK